MPKHISISVLLLLLLICFTSGGLLAQNLVPYRSGDLWGYSNMNGDIIIKPQFEKANPLENGTALFTQKGKQGVVNEEGKIIIEPNQYARIEKVEYFDLYMVQNQLGQTGIINLTGDIIVPPGKYEYLNSYSKNGFAKVKEDGEEGLINTKGEEVISIGEYNHFKIDRETGYVTIKNQKDNYGIVDIDGNEVIPAKYSWVKVLEEDYFIVMNGGKAGIVQNGELIIPIKYDKLDYANEQLFSYTLDDKKGYLNTNGKSITSGLSSNPHFKRGFAKVKKNGKIGIINTSGKAIIDFGKYDAIKDFENNVFEVKKDGKVGIVNAIGKEVITPNKYQKISNFTGGFAIVYNNGFGMVDVDGNEIAPCTYEGIEKIKDEGLLPSLTVQDPSYEPSELVVAMFYENEKYGLLNSKGKVILPAKYNRIGSSFAHCNLQVMQYYQAHSKYLYGFFNVDAEELLTPVKYSRAETFNTYKYDFPLVYLKDDEATFLSPDGNELINPTDLYTGLDVINEDLIILKGRQVHTLINWRTGKVIIEPYTYKEITLSKDKTMLCVYNQVDTQHSSSPKYGFVGIDGKPITEVKYDKVYGKLIGEFVKNGIMRVRIDGKDGYVNSQGKEFFD